MDNESKGNPQESPGISGTTDHEGLIDVDNLNPFKPVPGSQYAEKKAVDLLGYEGEIPLATVVSDSVVLQPENQEEYDELNLLMNQLLDGENNPKVKKIEEHDSQDVKNNHGDLNTAHTAQGDSDINILLNQLLDQKNRDEVDTSSKIGDGSNDVEMILSLNDKRQNNNSTSSFYTSTNQESGAAYSKGDTEENNNNTRRLTREMANDLTQPVNQRKYGAPKVVSLDEIEIKEKLGQGISTGKIKKTGEQVIVLELKSEACKSVMKNVEITNGTLKIKNPEEYNKAVHKIVKKVEAHKEQQARGQERAMSTTSGLKR